MIPIFEIKNFQKTIDDSENEMLFNKKDKKNKQRDKRNQLLLFTVVSQTNQVTTFERGQQL